MTDLGELLRRYGAGVRDHHRVAAVGAAIAVTLSLPATRAWLRRAPEAARRIGLALTMAAGLGWAWSLRWVADDAYISFRYAANLLAGNGLVWNPGERVEGYTNFLWTVLMVPFMALGIDPGQAALLGDLACFALVIVLTARLERRLSPEASVLVAPILTAASYPLASFATSGLETMFITLMALLAVERAWSGRPLAAGIAGIAGVMAHPDQAILYVALGLALAWCRDRRELGRYAAPFLLVYLPYFLLRWRYYGDPFPNTYYAKSVGESYFGHGFFYLALAFITAGLWGVVPAAVVGLTRGGLWSRLPGRYALIATPLFVGYIARIGGDFMQGRLLCPILPIWFVMAAAGMRQVRGRAAVALSLLAVAAVLPINVFAPCEKRWGITEERAFYPLRSVFPFESGAGYADQGKALRRRFAGRGVKPKLAVGGVGMIGYYSRLPMLDLLGLNDRVIAHRPVGARGTPGHEKQGGAGRVMAAGAGLADIPVYPPPFEDLTRVEVDGYSYYLSRYDRNLIAALRAPPAARVVDIEAELGRFLDRMERPGQLPPASDEMACQSWFYATYYFAAGGDPRLARRFESLMARADPVVEPSVAGLIRDPDGDTVARRISFEPADEIAFDPPAASFGRWLSVDPAPGQQDIAGQQRTFLDSFRDGGDAGRGALTSRELPLDGDLVSLRIGGGRDPQRLRVSLIVDGQRVASATGCGSELLGRRLWNTRRWRGHRAHFEIVDASSDGWGHILADEIVEWRGR